jgi:hypothetical protein
VDLANYLADNGIGTIGSKINISGYNDAVGNMVFITPFQGFEYYDIVTGEENSFQPSIQVLVRNLDNKVAIAKSNAVFRLLRNISNRLIGSTFFITVRATGPPAFIMRTNGGYYQYSLNFNLVFQ